MKRNRGTVESRGGGGAHGGVTREPVAGAFFWVRDAGELHAELRARGADIVYGPIVQEAYRMEEFAVRDRDGYVLGFGQALEPARPARS
jgi:hypothetical protein